MAVGGQELVLHDHLAVYVAHHLEHVTEENERVVLGDHQREWLLFRLRLSIGDHSLEADDLLVLDSFGNVDERIVDAGLDQPADRFRLNLLAVFWAAALRAAAGIIDVQPTESQIAGRLDRLAFLREQVDQIELFVGLLDELVDLVVGGDQNELQLLAGLQAQRIELESGDVQRRTVFGIVRLQVVHLPPVLLGGHLVQQAAPLAVVSIDQLGLEDQALRGGDQNGGRSVRLLLLLALVIPGDRTQDVTLAFD